MRELRGWAQSDLAAYSGIARQHVSDLENGKKEPSLRTIEIIAKTFEMTISQFMRGL